jgi:phosphoribosylamine--glycine ligase
MLGEDGKLTTTGGRVLCVVGLGDSVRLAQKHAYDVTDNIHFDGKQVRHDIGWRALKRPA